MTTAVEPTYEMLTLERIRVWAAGKTPDTAIGIGGDSTECPVACYLGELGVQKPRVDANTVRWYVPFVPRNRCRMDTPDVVRAVIQEVDSLKGFQVILSADLLAIITVLEQRP